MIEEGVKLFVCAVGVPPKWLVDKPAPRWEPRGSKSFLQECLRWWAQSHRGAGP